MSAVANPDQNLVLARIGSPLARIAPGTSPEATIDLDLADAEPAELEQEDPEHTERSDPPALMESGESPLFPVSEEGAAAAAPAQSKTALTAVSRSQATTIGSGAEARPSAMGSEPESSPQAAKQPDATSALLLTRPAQRRAPAGRFARWVRRAAVATLVLPALLAGGAYFARPFLPAWLVPAGLVEMVDGWIKRLPRSLDDAGGESATPELGSETSQR